MNNIIYDDYSLSDLTYELKENEQLTYFSLNRTCNITFILNDNAVLNYYQINTNDVNNIFNVNLNGKDAKAYCQTLTVTNSSNCNYIQNIIHNNRNTLSQIKNFGIALDNSKIIYETIGKINKGNIKANCNQTSRGVIIGDNATISSKPVLLIDEYDVFANHGAAIGKMSDDELFYLMSRGLSKKEALMLIISGLINPIIDKLDEKHRNYYYDLIKALIKD